MNNAWLEDACRLADRLEQMEAELAASSTGLMVTGYQGQPVIIRCSRRSVRPVR